MTLRNCFFFNVQFKQNRRKYLRNPFYSYFKAVTAASREEMGETAVRKGDTATKDRWEYISGL